MVAAGGELALAFVVIGIIAATFGAALWNDAVLRLTPRPVLRLGMGQVPAPRRGGPVPHAAMLVVLVACAAVLFTGVDPITWSPSTRRCSPPSHCRCISADPDRRQERSRLAWASTSTAAPPSYWPRCLW